MFSFKSFFPKFSINMSIAHSRNLHVGALKWRNKLSVFLNVNHGNLTEEFITSFNMYDEAPPSSISYGLPSPLLTCSLLHHEKSRVDCSSAVWLGLHSRP